MTLAVARPGANRSVFALAGGPAYPGMHAFCPWCEPVDMERWRQSISRKSHAGVFRLICRFHDVLLDGADEPGELDPWRDTTGRWRARLRARPARKAPLFALSFQRAVERAEEGRSPGGCWLVQEPAEFLRVTRELVGLVMVQRRSGQVNNSSSALSLLDERDLGRATYGPAMYEADLLDRLTAWPRARALAASGLLLLKRKALERLQVDVWVWQDLSPFNDWRGLEVNPWAVAAQAWSRETFELALGLSACWPAQLREAMHEQLRPRFAMWMPAQVGACQETQRAV